MMDEICEDAGAYHSKDMVTLEGTADERDTVLCGLDAESNAGDSGPAAQNRVILCRYHELRRLMRQSASERAARVVVLSGRE